MLRAELRAAVVQPSVRIRLAGLIRNAGAVLYASDHIYSEADVLLRPLPLRSLDHSPPESACHLRSDSWSATSVAQHVKSNPPPVGLKG